MQKLPVKLAQSGLGRHFVGFGVLSGLVRQKDALRHSQDQHHNDEFGSRNLQTLDLTLICRTGITLQKAMLCPPL